jgi:hypothetical protein
MKRSNFFRSFRIAGILALIFFADPYIFGQGFTSLVSYSNGGTKEDYLVYTTASPANNTFISVGFSNSTDWGMNAFRGSYDAWLQVGFVSGGSRPNWFYGGPGDDRFTSVAVLPNDQVVAVGFAGAAGADVTANKGSSDMWVVKIEAGGSGNILWQKSLGGSLADAGNTVLVLPNGDILVAGYTSSSDGDVTGHRGGKDLWVCKLSSAGDLVWQKTYGGSGNDEAFDMGLLPDGTVVIAGQTNSTNGQVSQPKGGGDYWLLKINQDGWLLWEKTFGGSGSDIGRSIAATVDGGFLVVG